MKVMKRLIIIAAQCRGVQLNAPTLRDLIRSLSDANRTDFNLVAGRVGFPRQRVKTWCREIFHSSAIRYRPHAAKSNIPSAMG